MSPTTATVFVQLSEVGEGCPDEYDPNSHYEPRDSVSYSAAPDRKIVYQCKVSELCNLH
jgi:hypothetical protein